MANQIKVARIFLSYTRKDEGKVRDLYQKLTAAGFRPWMDKEDILPGEDWKRAVIKAIRETPFFIACLSNNSINKRGIIQEEIKEALAVWREQLDSDIYLIPVRLEDCQVPETLSKFQWVDLFETTGFEQLVKSITMGIKRRGLTLPLIPPIVTTNKSKLKPSDSLQKRRRSKVKTRSLRKGKQRFFRALWVLGAFGGLPAVGLYCVELLLLYLNPVNVMSPESDRYYLYHVFSQRTGQSEFYYDLACWLVDSKKLFVLAALTMWATVLARTENHWRRAVLSSAGRGLPLWIICAVALALTFALNPAALWPSRPTSLPAFLGQERNLFFFLYRLWWPSFMFVAVTQYLIGIDSLRVLHKRGVARNVDRGQIDRLAVHVTSFPVIVFAVAVASGFAEKGDLGASRIGGYMDLIILVVLMHLLLLIPTLMLFGTKVGMKLELGVPETLRVAAPGVLGALVCLVLPLAGMKVGDALAGKSDEETFAKGHLEQYTTCLTSILEDGSGGKRIAVALEIDTRLRKEAKKLLSQDESMQKSLKLGQILKAYNEGSIAKEDSVNMEPCDALKLANDPSP